MAIMQMNAQSRFEDKRRVLQVQADYERYLSNVADVMSSLDDIKAVFEPISLDISGSGLDNPILDQRK